MTTKTRKQDSSNQMQLPFDRADKRVELVSFLREHAVEISLELSLPGFTGSAVVDQGESAAMARARQRELVAAGKANEDDLRHSVKALSSRVRMFSSDNIYVKRLNAARTAVMSYRDAHTCPIANITSSKVEMTAEDASKIFSKDPGKRLILAKDLDNFLENVDRLCSDLRAAVNDLNEHMDEVIEHDRSMTPRHLFDESRYGEIGLDVRGPYPTELGYSFQLQELAPAACKRAEEFLQERLSHTVEITIGDLANKLTDFVHTIAEQLNNRTRLRIPREQWGEEWFCLHEAEVISVLDIADYDGESPDTVTCGSGEVEMAVQLRRYIPRAGKGETKGKNAPQWYFFSRGFYEGMRPYTSDEKKRFTESSMLNLGQQCQSIRNVAEMLGNFGSPLVDVANRLDDIMANVGNTPEAAVDQLRNSSYVRNDVRRRLLETVANMETIPVVQDNLLYRQLTTRRKVVVSES